MECRLALYIALWVHNSMGVRNVVTTLERRSVGAMWQKAMYEMYDMYLKLLSLFLCISYRFILCFFGFPKLKNKFLAYDFVPDGSVFILNGRLGICTE